MSKPARNVLIASIAVIAAALGLIGLRAFQPPVPLSKVESLKAGMSPEDMRRILGSPSRIYPGGQQYTVRGTNYTTAEQWTYQRFLTFGYVNVLFTNSTVSYGHYEEF